MASKQVIIGGGTGYIGSCLRKLLARYGVRTLILSRMPGPDRLSWLELEKQGLPQGTSAVINVAGQNVFDFTQRWTPGFKQNVWNSRVRTTQMLAKAVENSDVETFVTISGVAYYPPDGKEYHEDSKCEKYDFLSELCHAWEDAAKLPSSSSARQVTIRSGVVLGRYGGMIKQTFVPFFLGLGGPVGSGTQVMPWIHIHDLCNLFYFALKNPDVKGVLNGVAPEIITNAQFTKAFASQLRRPAFIPLPEFVLRLLLNEERAKIMLEGQKVVPKRVLDYNFKYEYPTIQEACKQFGVIQLLLPDDF